MTKIIDTHAHYYHGKYRNYLGKLLDEMREDVCAIINIGTNDASNKKVLSMAKDYDLLYSMIGFFPNDVLELENDNIRTFFETHIEERKNVGIGEIGLDYHWDVIEHSIQERYFRYQIELATMYHLPVSMHSRDAEKDTFRILSEYSGALKGVIHCYSNGPEYVEDYVKMGLYFGVGGTSTYPSNESGREAIKLMPMDRILLETDAPYLSPQPVRRSTNKSSYIIYVAENLANIKGISVEDVLKQNQENVKKLFNIDVTSQEENK